MSLAQYSKEELQEFSLLEMAYEYLKNSKQPISFSDLVSEIQAAAGISDEEIRTRLAQFYTEMNIDGRFRSIGENRWALRLWYPVDTQEEEVITAVKPKRKKAKKVVDEGELDDFDEIEEDYEDEDDLDDFEDEDDLLDDDDSVDLEEIDEFDEDSEDEDDTEIIDDDEEFDMDEDDLEDEDEVDDEENL